VASAAGVPGHAQQLMLVEHDVLQLPRGEYAGWPLA
jgi:hypothetical protein